MEAGSARRRQSTCRAAAGACEIDAQRRSRIRQLARTQARTGGARGWEAGHGRRGRGRWRPKAATASPPCAAGTSSAHEGVGSTPADRLQNMHGPAARSPSSAGSCEPASAGTCRIPEAVQISSQATSPDARSAICDSTGASATTSIAKAAVQAVNKRAVRFRRIGEVKRSEMNREWRAWNDNRWESALWLISIKHHGCVREHVHRHRRTCRIGQTPGDARCAAPARRLTTPSRRAAALPRSSSDNPWALAILPPLSSKGRPDP